MWMCGPEYEFFSHTPPQLRSADVGPFFMGHACLKIYTFDRARKLRCAKADDHFLWLSERVNKKVGEKRLNKKKTTKLDSSRLDDDDADYRRLGIFRRKPGYLSGSVFCT